MQDPVNDVVILGSGPAGLTAAIYTARANLKPTLIEGAQSGGQLMITTDVENYPGFPNGIEGPPLILEMKKQAERFGTTFIAGDATEVDLSARPFTIVVDGEKTLRTKSLIIASGARAKLLGLESESRLMGRGVSACATCDGFFFRGKEVFVVGGGDTAVEEATFLTRFANTVTLIHRRNTLRASKIMQDRAFRNPKMKFLWETAVVDILEGEFGKIGGLLLKNLKNDQTFVAPADGIFIAIGHEPNTSLFQGNLTLDERGYIITKPSTTQTSIVGVFAAGDVQDPTYRQAVTAAGTGCMAAIDAERFLEAESHIVIPTAGIVMPVDRFLP
ncbi:MAG: thioredoxin-disulfide reductase [Nitrospirae bacterium]|nr:thioredoxin-disulfide reductase [Candidatus Troglogloeales bacterium]